MLGPCPHCKNENASVYVNRRSFGWMKHWYYEDGSFCETDLGGMHSKDSKTVRCGVCDKIRRDLKVEGNKIVRKYPRRES